MKENTYPGFDYNASQLSAYAYSIDIFFLSLKDGKVVNFSPEDAESFRKWLIEHGVRNIADAKKQ